MKKYLLPLLILVLAVEALNPLHASSQDKPNESKKLRVIVKPSIKLEIAKTKVEIVPGESEVQKQAKSRADSSRELVARERPVEVATAPDLSLEDLRNLYRAAGAKYGIDWKLIEAVHQVETGKSTGTCKQSYAGATGPMQFLPSTFRHYANEGDNICDLEDSIFAAANLLAQAGAASGDIDSALFSYNHSQSYVNLVKSVMNSI